MVTAAQGEGDLGWTLLKWDRHWQRKAGIICRNPEWANWTLRQHWRFVYVTPGLGCNLALVPLIWAQGRACNIGVEGKWELFCDASSKDALPNSSLANTHGNYPRDSAHTVYPKKYAHGFCFAVLCCGYTLTDFPISIRLTSLALWQSNDCPSASKATLMNMDKYFMWIHYERLHNHNKAKQNKTVCIFLGIYCSWGAGQYQEQLKILYAYSVIALICFLIGCWDLFYQTPKCILLCAWIFQLVFTVR